MSAVFVEESLFIEKIVADRLLSDANLVLSIQWETGCLLNISREVETGGKVRVLVKCLPGDDGFSKLQKRMAEETKHRSMKEVVEHVMTDNKQKNSTKKTGSKGRLVEAYKLGEIRLFDVEHLASERNGFKSTNTPNQTSFSRAETHTHVHSKMPRSTSRQTSLGSLDEGPVSASALTHTSHQESRRVVSYNVHVNNDELILNDIVRRNKGTGSTDAFVRAGPRSSIHFDPKHVKAAVVTCGGLCPGLNNVIREVVHALYFLYGVQDVTGIVGGYNGFHSKNWERMGYPVKLTLDSVHDCHHTGGTILASSRGGLFTPKATDSPAKMKEAEEDLNSIIDYLATQQINQLYVIGGDGTHRGANRIAHECIRRRMEVSVVCIPKTIDNDIDLIDRSFGFESSVEAAQNAILSAKTEARCNMPNGIGIVKLMGRSAGYIAAHATLASGDVDLCLVPEIEAPSNFDKFAKEKKTAFLKDRMNKYCAFLKDRLRDQGHVVIVVAEGAMEKHLADQEGQLGYDKGGNAIKPEFQKYLKDAITSYFANQDDPRFNEVTIKYIDPSYMIRSVPANAADSLYCMMLGQNAVHGAMAGFTAFSVGIVNTKMVYIPIERLVETSPRQMDANGRTWERVLAITGQEQFIVDDYDKDPYNDQTVCSVSYAKGGSAVSAPETDI